LFIIVGDWIDTVRNSLMADVGGKRQNIGQAVVDGENLSDLTSDLAHGEHKLETMRAALAEIDQVLQDAENGWKTARAEESQAEIVECYQAGINKYKSASGAFDEVEKIVKEILAISKQARDAHSELNPFVLHDESQVTEVKVYSLKKPAAILMVSVNHYRSYLKIDRLLVLRW